MRISPYEFLRQRREFMASAQQAVDNCDPGGFCVVVDSGEDIICDLCNDDISLDSDISIIGSYALCVACVERSNVKTK